MTFRGYEMQLKLIAFEKEVSVEIYADNWDDLKRKYDSFFGQVTAIESTTKKKTKNLKKDGTNGSN